MGCREWVRGEDGITIRKESDLSWHLHESKAGRHGREVDRIFVAKRVVTGEMDVLPGHRRNLLQHRECLLVAVALVALE